MSFSSWRTAGSPPTWAHPGEPKMHHPFSTHNQEGCHISMLNTKEANAKVVLQLWLAQIYVKMEDWL